MNWGFRFLLSIATLIIALLFGAFGGFFGGFLRGLLWIPIIWMITFLLLPWKELLFSQEELEKDIKTLNDALQETQEMLPKLEALRLEIEEKEALNQEELDDAITRFQELRTPSVGATRALREMLFGEHRRMVVVLVIILFLAGVGGSLLVPYFERIFS